MHIRAEQNSNSSQLTQKPKLLTKEQVCQTLQISPRCLEGMIKNRRLPAGIRIGRSVYWSESVIDAWVSREFGIQEGFFRATSSSVR
nr:helix-turn-helix domain-containing protein [uncultured Roseateles sp.]